MIFHQFQYCKSLTEFSRFNTGIVDIGGVPMGGNNPIRIQTMTNTNTLDTKATVTQCIRCVEAGAEYIRITAPGIKEAENLANIKEQLKKQGYNIPLIADIHFNPKAAEVAATIVAKVRINPGNYTDKKHFDQLEFTESEYNDELIRIHKKLLPLLKICKQHQTAIRIGVNHGSLSDRIMSRYGDTANGMVEAALEFLRICASENFHQLVVSLKSSNTRIMVQAYRLLVNRMTTEGMNYPLHLGVTEAGDGEDGRIKSAVGIGTLLADGIGDTVRVSLTEDPEAELPVARNIVHYFEGRKESTPINFVNEQVKNPFEYQKRDSQTIENIGGKNIPIVISDWVRDETYHQIDKSTRPDYYYITIPQENEQYPIENKYIVGLKDWITTYQSQTNFFPILSAGELILYGEKSEILNFVILSASDMSFGLIKALKRCKKTVAIIETFNLNGIAEQRSILYTFIDNNISLPVIINRNYCEEESVGFQIKSACDLSSLFIDGLGDGLWLRNVGNVDLLSIISTSFGILQASRVRTSKTEYISCPSCGRTLFDLQATTAKIKEKTKHLKHLKIGIMGCIVNGPGEMADADYGYVGAAAGKITLYKGKEVIKKNIKADNAVDELIQIIKQNGDWVDFN